MAKSTSQIVVAGTGSILVAPVATVAPVDVATPWAAAWIDLGYTNEDGVTFTDEKTVEDIMLWQLFYPGRTIVTARNSTAAFSLAQWNKDTVPLAFGGGTITTTPGPPAHYRYSPPAPGTVDERALGIEIVDGSVIKRFIIPRCVVSEAVETNLVKSTAANLPITVKALGTDGVDPWYFRSNSAAYAA